MSQLFPSQDHKNLLMTLLKVMGADKVVVDFSGGGDSGSINGVGLIDHNGNEIDISKAEFEWVSQTDVWVEGKKDWLKESVPEVMPLKEILQNIAEAALDTTSLDWYNNEGGQGVFTIDLRDNPPTLELEVGINTMTTEDYKFNFSDDE